jgi:hypothetical protein
MSGPAAGGVEARSGLIRFLGKLCFVWLRRIVVPGHGTIDRMAIERSGL